MTAIFNLVDSLPNWAFVGLVVVIYGALGIVLTALDEWERRRG